jgi:hypothetical protein
VKSDRGSGAGTAAKAVRVRIPDVLRRLREPWFDEGIPPGLKSYVRFAASLSVRDGQAHVVRYASGGGGTMIEEALDPEQYETLRRLMDREYFPPVYEDGASEELDEFLRARGVSLKLSRGHIPRGVFEVTKEILRVLPESHLGHGYFRTLEMGGWGRGAAKCSEHSDSNVHMFTFAVKGPVRNYVALLLHETGHALFDLMERRQGRLADVLRGSLAEIGAYGDGEAGPGELMPFALDFLWGPESRAEETLGDIHEFVAECYLMYVVRGVGLNDQAGALPDGLAGPWTRAYEILRGAFGGVEYE